MVNQDIPRGFRPHGKILSCNSYLHAVGDATAVYPGDVVKTAAGYITSASAANRLRGVAKNYCAADTAGEVLVYDDPQQLFIVQDDAGATLTQAEVGENCEILATTGDTTLLLSQQEIAAAGHQTATAQVRIMGVASLMYPNGVENAVGDNCDWIVRINEHELATAENVGT